MVFDRDGKLVRAGAEREMDGERVTDGWLHSGEVDWDGHVWMVKTTASSSSTPEAGLELARRGRAG